MSDAINKNTTTKRLFDRTALYTLKETDANSDTGVKTCTVEFPTDAQWCRRSRQQVTVARAGGRGVVDQKIPRLLEVNSELYDQICKSQSNEFDPEEQLHVINRLERCEVVDSVRVGAHYQITMKVLGGIEVVHILKTPSRKQTIDYGKHSIDTKAKRFGQEVKVMLEPTMELWKALVVGFDGYVTRDNRITVADPVGPTELVNPVPVVHMDVAITELTNAIHAELSDESSTQDDTASGE